MHSQHLWCPMHGWHDAGQCPDMKEDAVTTFEYVVHVEAATRDQADQVMAERLTHDEDYGFPYTVSYDYETSED